ncbi:MFS transporter [Actinomadura monticuli]|uniref:MFS transporter n=1 Tax=Actinomadura monticuli TaxID=3097367 RepID=A0ABV4QED6_9ACTN
MSEHPPSPWFRIARAVVFATVCVTLAVLGHVLAGGDAVPGWAGMTGFGAVLGVSLMLAGHERSLATILGGLLGGQFALHTLFTQAAPATHHAPAMAHHTPAMHGAMSSGADAMAAPAAHGAASGLVMTLAHCVAALVAAWWLRRGERAAWTVARRVAAAADRPVRLLLALLTVEKAVPPRPVPVVPAPVAGPAVGRVLRHQVVRRGPPPRSRALAHS